MLFQDEALLKSLRSKREEFEVQETISESRHENIQRSEYNNNKDYRRALMWESIQNGKRVNKIFESKDGNYISNFTVQGNVEKIEKELVFIRGILEKEKNN
ncbi:hypothetical protein P9152_20410 [Bacillus subtilis]|uniref:hypothetical protein n=2 Tax=Bacillaceae TaxID=186817 RepID=UPI002DB9BA94|nr:hypothetical protein [Bacillus subtilis]MEC3620847.1 hypothetical protein [Bacillus subtilis]MEC3637145.1 hypothetical protein [Bacillus subtilis]MEC3643929.1 hypothetical protein [Bacillus subtilis]MEC3649310.1 hypothetical protein [Bacillus subtilis]MEC3700267.1 hypothetical protein [Bacillus subtilis]